MKISKLAGVLEQAFKNDVKVLTVGEPGIGKTAAVHQAATKLGYDVVDFSSPIEDPTTIRGYPIKTETGPARHLLFEKLYKLINATRPTVAFFDDLGMAGEATLKAVLQLIQFKYLDGQRLPDYVVITAATNDVDRASGVANFLEPLKTRFHAVIPVETSAEDVIDYGARKNWEPEVLAYLQCFPEAVLERQEKDVRSVRVQHASPRGWENVSTLLRAGITQPEAIEGAVGVGRGREFYNFRRLQRRLPNLTDIFNQPDKAPLPDDPSVSYMLSSLIVRQVTEQNIANALRYLRRVGEAYITFAVRLLIRKNDKVVDWPAFQAWITTEGQSIMEILKKLE